MSARDDVRAYGFIRCRALLGHAWADESYTKGPAGQFVYTSTCSRCQTTKAATYSKFGYLMGATYQYPEGYRLSGEVSRVDLRVELFRRGGS